MNTIHLIGRCGGDPEIKTFEWGKVAKFSLATSESYKNKQGEKITETDWHNLLFRGSVCDTLEKWVHKGDQIAVTGRVKYRSYENKDGVTVYVTEIICSHFEFCGGSKKESRPSEGPAEEKWHGKKQVGSMSDINELPGADESNLPF